MSADLFNFMDAPIAPRPTAQQLADDGMMRAADHADAVEEGWSERAYSMLLDYAAEHFEFMTEDVRHWSIEQGFSLPPDGRAWGQVIRTASKLKLICKHGYGQTSSPNMHKGLATIWKRTPALNLV